MTDIKHIDADDLTLYALHALEPDEAAAVARHLHGCEQCSRAVAESRGDMALVAFSVDQAPLPAGAEQRFMARVAASAATTPSRPVLGGITEKASSDVIPFDRPVQPRRSRWPIIVPWAIAAAASIFAVTLSIENKNLNDTVGAESALLNTVSSKASHAQQIVDALNSPHAQRVTLTATKHAAEPTGQAIYLADRGSLLFQANNLKPLEKGKTYELWVIPADGKAPVAAGTFQPDQAGYASVVLPKLPSGIPAKAFGVTIENAGGASTPTMPIILAGG